MATQRARHHHLFPNLLFLVPITVHTVDTILQDCVFGGLISFFSPIFTNCDRVNNINTYVISPFHLQNLLDIHLDTQIPLLDYLNYFIYLQQSLKQCFAHCFIVILKRFYTWNLIETCISAYLNNVWESCKLIGKDN